MPPLFMDPASSSPGFTSGEQGHGSNSSMRQGDGTGPEPVPGPGPRKDKNRDAARKSRRKQTQKADELHQEYQCLERSNAALEREIAALRAEVQHYTAALERHQPSCLLLAPGPALSMASFCTSSSSSGLSATALPSEASSSPADSHLVSESARTSPDPLRVCGTAPGVLVSGGTSPPRPPAPPRSAPGPHGHAPPSATPPCCLPPAALSPSPLPPPPAPPGGRCAPRRPQAGPASLLQSLLQDAPGSGPVQAYPTGPPYPVFPAVAPPGPGPFRGPVSGTPLPTLGFLEHLEGLLPPPPTGCPFPSDPAPPLLDFAGDAALTRLLQTDDWFLDC